MTNLRQIRRKGALVRSACALKVGRIMDEPRESNPRDTESLECSAESCGVVPQFAKNRIRSLPNSFLYLLIFDALVSWLSLLGSRSFLLGGGFATVGSPWHAASCAVFVNRDVPDNLDTERVKRLRVDFISMGLSASSETL